MKEVICISIGTNIKKFRKEKNLKQQELAELLGVAPITVRQYESGKRKPNLTKIFEIAEHLDISINDLIAENLEKNISSDNLDAKIDLHSSNKSSEENETEIVCKTNMNISEIKNLPINRAFQKYENGEPLDPEEQQALDSFIQSGGFQRVFKDLSESTRKLADILRENYELLNEEGQKKADKHIEYATEQIEMLTRIPGYRKED